MPLIEKVKERYKVVSSFKNRMVNEENYKFVDGGNNEELISRMLEGLKPFASIDYWINRPETSHKVNEAIEKLQKNKNLDIKVHKRRTPGTADTDKPNVIDILVAAKGKIKDLFDLAALTQEYKQAGLDIAKQVEEVKDTEIKDWFENWDEHGWFTGLLLGYPITATIDLYGNNWTHCTKKRLLMSIKNQPKKYPYAENIVKDDV
jgi:hypothetical protein